RSRPVNPRNAEKLTRHTGDRILAPERGAGTILSLPRLEDFLHCFRRAGQDAAHDLVAVVAKAVSNEGWPLWKRQYEFKTFDRGEGAPAVAPQREFQIGISGLHQGVILPSVGIHTGALAVDGKERARRPPLLPFTFLLLILRVLPPASVAVPLPLPIIGVLPPAS